MPSNFETFWQNDSFAVVGDREKRNFPELTYRGLKALGKRVFPVDPSLPHFDGDKVFPNLSALPEKVDAVVLEVPKEDTREWLEQAAGAGIEHAWIHMGRDTPEALELAREKGINARHGTCAVMYVTPGFTFHSLHKVIMKLMGKF